MTAPTPRGVREAHQELYGNASVSLEFAAHDLAPENAPFNLAKVRGFIREARESVNLACNALMRAMTPPTAPTAAEREERPPVVTLSWGEYDSLRAALLAGRRGEETRTPPLRDAFASGVYIALRTMLNHGPDAMRAGIEGSGLTTRQIADAIGLAGSDVQAISRGERAITSEEYTRLAKVLSLGAGWLEYQQLSLNSDGQISGFIVIDGQRWEAPTRAALAATPEGRSHA